MDVVSLAFRTDLALLARAGSEVEDRGDRVVVRTPTNPAFHWGNFFLLRRAPTIDEVPELLTTYDAEFFESRHRAIGIDGVTDQRASLGPLTAAGLDLDIGVTMTATAVHEPPRPNRDAELRPLAGDDDWTQRLELSVATNEDEPPEDFLTFARGKAASDRVRSEAGEGAWWGAFLDGRLASSMGVFSASPGLARFQSVETHPDFRGRGLAGTLAHRVGRYALDELEARQLVMAADPDYLAIRIYRSIGFADTEWQTQLSQRRRTGVDSSRAPGTSP
jgi:ribosomal protein S18 acetylase RimI-like enzyme